MDERVYLEEQEGIPLGREVTLALCFVGPVHYESSETPERGGDLFCNTSKIRLVKIKHEGA